MKPAIYFIGIGGIGMSALARYCKARGLAVAGYDRSPSPLTDALAREGIDIHFTDDIESVDPIYRDPARCLVCYTPAVHQLGELAYFESHGFEVVKRSQLLGLISRPMQSVCVAGTHGKTTTSSMIAHILKQSHVDCNAFLGGVLKPYDTNLMLSATSPIAVIEADEYDRSFHTLSPSVAVVTSCDPDHLDIYGTEAAYRESFAHFTGLVRPGGLLLKHRGVRIEPRLSAGTDYAEYDVLTPAEVQALTAEGALPDYYATDVRIGGGTIRFDFVARREGLILRDMEPGVPVAVNVDNATAALAVCLRSGCTEDELREGLRTFAGAKRRFDFHVRRDDLVIMDDYAHHPDEITASIRSVRQLFAGRHLTLLFQPHLYSRTRDLAEGFARALALPDRLLLLPIYPAREEPIPGITSGWLRNQIDLADKRVVLCEDAVATLRRLREWGQLDVLVTMGAGVDIERLLPAIVATLK